jgi:glutamate/aspartate transport system permease protein
MFENFDFDVIARSWQTLIFQGLGFTLEVTVLSMIGGIILGTLLAMARLSSIKPLSWLAGGYVNLLRSIPLVLVIFWFYFLMPYIGAWIIGANRPIKVGAFASALITFVFFQACYYCEIMRAGIQSIPRGQSAAGYALGFSYWHVMRYVILPQAFRNMLPVLLTQTVILFQDVSLVYIISLPDIVTVASQIAQRDGRLVEMYIFVAIVYFVICFALSQGVRRLQAKLAIGTI